MNNDFDLECYLRDLLNTIQHVHDENVKNKAEYYNYIHIFTKKEIDYIAEAWDKCNWFEVS